MREHDKCKNHKECRYLLRPAEREGFLACHLKKVSRLPHKATVHKATVESEILTRVTISSKTKATEESYHKATKPCIFHISNLGLPLGSG